MEPLPKETLLIETWYSTCNNCNEHCDPSEKSHDTVLGYGAKEGDKGCGITWKYVSTSYSDFSGLYDGIKEMRPDLEFIDQCSWFK